MTPINSISPLKKTFPNNHVTSQKYPRNSPAGFNPKSWMDDGVGRSDNIFPFQERTRSFDSFNMNTLESSLIDIMRAEQDTLKGRLGFPHPGGDNPLPLNGHSSLFPMEDGFPDDERGDQGLAGLGSPHCFPHQNGERVERYSRKVFVGGLPPDIDEDEITASFRRFGHLFVDWPHKAESKSYFPPKGYAFLLFQDESSVQALIDACIEEDGKLYLCVSSPTIKDKPVQIRPWNLNDSDFVMDGSQPLDPRKTIFVGGVPRPLRADPELKYPKGAGRVAFSNQQSYIAAISARFVQLQHGEIDKRVEVKPYVLDDQLCDECQGTRCGGKFAPFFCANVTCLQYYCEYCWAAIHSRAGREFHKPLVKEGGDRPRAEENGRSLNYVFYCFLQDVLKDLESTRCGHWFCRLCIASDWYQSSSSGDSSCPQCGKRSRTSYGLQTANQTSTVQMSGGLQVLNEHKISLKTRHERVTEGSDETGSGTLLNRIYTELYIREGQSEEVNTQHEVRQLETASKKETLRDNLTLTLTNGVAGIGKTFSVLKFTLDWAEGSENQDVSLVVLLLFRQVNLLKDERFSLFMLLHVLHPTIQKVTAEKLTVCKLLFIFDGLDETTLSLDFNKEYDLLH
ncbi:Cytoplasmic polyadenylation element-binding protein 4 [Nibea albiflora]|uniref:Cytoplasmic polyadenylation element-binding protein 4 n=1 Tax=Nibea albiflora TaxID=240163 RepID=A0ACB7F0S8_NIBAL|nr:Cytoplasmic polyadenylation element-binding protein 4 [Nibea albiflora]